MFNNLKQIIIFINKIELTGKNRAIIWGFFEKSAGFGFTIYQKFTIIRGI